MPMNLDDLLETNPSKEVGKPKSATAEPITAPRATQAAQHDNTSLDDVEITYSPSRVTNYSTLKTLAQTFQAFAFLTGMAGGISILASFVYFHGGNPEMEFYIYLALGVLAFFFTAQLNLFSQGINVILDIEANSRQAAKTLERILHSQ